MSGRKWGKQTRHDTFSGNQCFGGDLWRRRQLLLTPSTSEKNTDGFWQRPSPGSKHAGTANTCRFAFLSRRPLLRSSIITLNGKQRQYVTSRATTANRRCSLRRTSFAFSDVFIVLFSRTVQGYRSGDNAKSRPQKTQSRHLKRTGRGRAERGTGTRSGKKCAVQLIA